MLSFCKVKRSSDSLQVKCNLYFCHVHKIVGLFSKCPVKLDSGLFFKSYAQRLANCSSCLLSVFHVVNLALHFSAELPVQYSSRPEHCSEDGVT